MQLFVIISLMLIYSAPSFSSTCVGFFSKNTMPLSKDAAAENYAMAQLAPFFLQKTASEIDLVFVLKKQPLSLDETSVLTGELPRVFKNRMIESNRAKKLEVLFQFKTLIEQSDSKIQILGDSHSLPAVYAKGTYQDFLNLLIKDFKSEKSVIDRVLHY